MLLEFSYLLDTIYFDGIYFFNVLLVTDTPKIHKMYEV